MIRRLSSLLLLIPALAAAQNPYFPLEPGRSWVYDSAQQGIYTDTVHSVEQVGDETHVSVRRVLDSDPGAWSDNTYVVDAQGRVWATGSVSSLGALYGANYDPPILVCDADVPTEGSWTSDYQSRNQQGDVIYEGTITYTILWTETINVPAGPYTARKIERVQTSDYYGYPTTSTKYVWYVEGLGLICSDLPTGGYLVELVNAGFNGVSNDVTSWGSLKAAVGDPQD